MFSQKCIPIQKFAVLGAHRNTILAVWYDRCVTKCAVVKGLRIGSSAEFANIGNCSEIINETSSSEDWLVSQGKFAVMPLVFAKCEIINV